jgi:hypothetical protein
MERFRLFPQASVTGFHPVEKDYTTIIEEAANGVSHAS